MCRRARRSARGSRPEGGHENHPRGFLPPGVVLFVRMAYACFAGLPGRSWMRPRSRPMSVSENIRAEVRRPPGLMPILCLRARSVITCRAQPICSATSGAGGAYDHEPALIASNWDIISAHQAQYPLLLCCATSRWASSRVPLSS